jgi:hypothetical protein
MRLIHGAVLIFSLPQHVFRFLFGLPFEFTSLNGKRKTPSGSRFRVSLRSSSNNFKLRTQNSELLLYDFLILELLNFVPVVTAHIQKHFLRILAETG